MGNPTEADRSFAQRIYSEAFYLENESFDVNKAAQLIAAHVAEEVEKAMLVLGKHSAIQHITGPTVDIVAWQEKPTPPKEKKEVNGND